MKRLSRELWRRERQRRREARLRKYHKHHRHTPPQPKKQLAIVQPSKNEVPFRGVVNSPNSLSIIGDVVGCVRFFANIRQQANEVQKSGKRSVSLNISEITQIDLPTTMVLNALGRELGGRGINLNGNFPNDENCLDFFVKTGFLNDKVNGQGFKFNKSEKTDYFTFNKGQGKLRVDDTIRICQIARHACDHLGKEDFYDDVVSIIKEIAGNSIEWSKSYKDQWTLGVMFEDDKVTFSILDLGRGILDTIYRKFIERLKGVFDNDIDFLNNVFDKQYSSSSCEENRYKGLPSIKKAYIEGKIQKLHVMTNNVLMDFDRPSSSVQFSTSRKAFNGTLYFWEITK